MREVIFYKSGDGESWLKSYYVDGNKQELTEEQTDELERKFHHIIWLHDHDNNSGNGKIVIIDGIVTADSYNEEEG